jgi:hypothetical protein
MFGIFVDSRACEPELAAEAAGAFQPFVAALAALHSWGASIVGLVGT